MSTQLNGTSGITFPDASTMASSEVGMKNRIIDGGFIINQRGYVSNTALSSGVYAHDRWKAGSGGCTYTFTQAAAGVNTTITITAGTLVQVIEGCNLPEGGTYVLSWTGTAQGRLNGGSYGASGITITGWTAGTNLNVEFNTGTVGSVQLEKGSTATSFDYRPYGTELALCQRYYQQYFLNTGTYAECVMQGTSATQGQGTIPLKVTMRAAPTTSKVGGTIYMQGGLGAAGASLALSTGTLDSSAIVINTPTSVTANGNACSLYTNVSNTGFTFSAEL